MKRTWRVLVGLGLAVAASGCSTVKMHRLRSDYETVDRPRVKRLVVVTQPLPEGNAKLGELWGLLARRYVNQKRDFIARESRAGEGSAFDPQAHCGEGVEGVLWLEPHVKRQGSGVEASTRARLFRCTDGEEVWAAEGGGSWPSADSQMTEVTAHYVAEVGPEVEPYVAPFQHVLAPVLDTLPNPLLTEDDKTEKIELGE